MEIIRVGVDLAKNVFQLHGVDGTRRRYGSKSLRRGQWLRNCSAGGAGGRDRDGGVCGGASLGA